MATDGEMEELDATSLTPQALAAAASRSQGRRVALTNLRVRHRKRKGAKLFFVMTEAGSSVGGGTFEIQLCAMRARDGCTDEGAARLGAEEHAAAYEGATPGATIAKAWGVLEQRASGGSGSGCGEGGDGGGGGVGDDDTGGSDSQATRRCRNCGVMSCAGAAPNGVCPSSGTPVLRLEGIELFTSNHGDNDDDADKGNGVDASGCWIVFDMAYDATMTEAEHGGLSRQVSMCVAANKRAKQPFLIAVASDNPADDNSGGEAAAAAASDDSLSPFDLHAVRARGGSS
jgi:hypothetical protein